MVKREKSLGRSFFSPVSSYFFDRNSNYLPQHQSKKNPKSSSLPQNDRSVQDITTITTTTTTTTTTTITITIVNLYLTNNRIDFEIQIQCSNSSSAKTILHISDNNYLSKEETNDCRLKPWGLFLLLRISTCINLLLYYYCNFFCSCENFFFNYGFYIVPYEIFLIQSQSFRRHCVCKHSFILNTSYTVNVLICLGYATVPNFNTLFNSFRGLLESKETGEWKRTLALSSVEVKNSLDFISSHQNDSVVWCLII